ncbi:MAG TPA: phosphoglucosamine mutase [candidate division Zixibacteria bacterium]|nr:phosphoglucosamine mutase [candidate division Zixibacteria bacterium]
MEPQTARNKPQRRLFGTDGVRGIANQEPMTSEMALKLGRAIARVLQDPVARPADGRSRPPSLAKILGGDKGHRYKILIGKDTRLSGYMLETALASGITSMGADVLLVGPLPTPGVAYLTRSMRADAGVVISASHNPYQDNGIKFFSWDGFKLPDEVEARMEEMIFNGETERDRPTASKIGKAFRIADALGRYVVFLKNCFPRHLTLEGLRIVADCGHGAAYKVVPEALSELGAEVIPVGVQPDGENINRRCGALHPETAREVLLREKADLAVSLDGDADRAIFVDEKGEVVDGDEVLAICAKDMHERGALKKNGVVATVMSNLGLELALKRSGIRLVRTEVGDRYVAEKMLEGGYNLGGEQSGHILFLDHNTTGDGAITCLQVLALMVESGRRLGELKKVMERLPQVLINVKVREKRDLRSMPAVAKKIADVERAMNGRGRTLVRYSGTEMLARVMLEGEEEARIREMAEEIAAAIRAEVGAPS